MKSTPPVMNMELLHVSVYLINMEAYTRYGTGVLSCLPLRENKKPRSIASLDNKIHHLREGRGAQLNLMIHDRLCGGQIQMCFGLYEAQSPAFVDHRYRSIMSPFDLGDVITRVET